MIINSGDRISSKTFFRCKENRALWRLISCHLTRSKSIQPFWQRETFSHPLSVGGALFPADVFAVTVSHSSPQTFAQVRSRFLANPPYRRQSHPPRYPSLLQAHTAPGGAHPVAPPSDRDLDAPPRLRTATTTFSRGCSACECAAVPRAAARDRRGLECARS